MYDKNIQEVTQPLAEYTPVGEEYPAPAPEYPRAQAVDHSASGPDKRRLLRFLLGAVLVSGMLLLPRLDHSRAPASPAVVPVTTAAPAPTPKPAEVPAAQTTETPTAQPEATAAPASTPEPVVLTPVVQPLFYNFSHEHLGSVRLENTESLRGVVVTVRETELDQTVFEHELDSGEISRGLYELPVLSTGDVYMDNMAAYDQTNAWPSFEMKVEYRYENAGGDEEIKELVLEPQHETGFGASYWGPGYTWDEQLPPDSFIITPWDEADDIRYVFDSPDSVTDYKTVYVDVEYNGRHVLPEEYETILKKDEYFLMDDVDFSTPLTSYTSELIIRRPDWMPESGTLHITIVSKLISTGELYTRTIDLDYPPVF